MTSGSTISRPGVSSKKASRKGPTAPTSSHHALQDLPTAASTMLSRPIKKKRACPKFVRNYYLILIAGLRRSFRHHVRLAFLPCLLIVEIACSGSGLKYDPRGSQSIDQAGTKYRPDRRRSMTPAGHQVARHASPFYFSTWTSFTRPFSWISTLSAILHPLNGHPRKFIYQS